MKLKIDNKEHLVNIIPADPQGVFDVRIGRKRMRIDPDEETHIRKLSNNLYLVNIRNDHYYVEVLDTSSEEKKIIRAPMQGVVQRVHVEPDQKVRKGQVLMSIFSMKLQNEILADRKSTVKEVFAENGATVNKGDRLIEIR